MSAATGSASDRVLRFQAAAAEYLEAREAGRTDELSALLARHSDLADELATFIADQDAVACLAAPLREAMAAASDVLPLALPGEHGRLGDFRINREVGRGGMGIVYEAEQVSLGRRVALKVLPFGAMMDPRQLQRFHTEARAAAGLHHSNIVPVFAVGSERGIHYYAMQFIEGRTLAQLIEEQRGGPSSPMLAPRRQLAAVSASTVPVAAQATSAAPRDATSFRRLAEWGIQAAEALDYAHSVGVVHRDVKPANLLVDTAGRLWVTDFGLAQVQNDPRLTMTGDLVGTLRYMSPEQALAQRPLIDHRTDVYSLGATLYELLTLQPALDGLERQELLRQIELEEPRPPRRHNPAVPLELELIVLKALEKDPAHRYGTAKDLADDLRCFLEDRPLHARRPTSWQRAAKWARRHRAVVRAFSLGLILAVIALAVSTWLVWRAYRAEAKQRQLADMQYRRAREQGRQARQAVDTMYLDVAQNWFDRQPGASELQKQFLAKALQYYQAFAEDEEDDEEARSDRAMAYVRVGRILTLSLAKEGEAQAPLRRANALLEELARQHPDKGNYALRLADAKVQLAYAGAADRRQLFEKGVRLMEGLVARSPSNPEYRHALALHLISLGMDLTMSGGQKEGGELCRHALILLESLVRDSPATPGYYKSLAGAAANLAESEQQAGQWEEAADTYRKAAAAYEHLTPHPVGLPEYQHDLLPFYWHNLGIEYRNLGTVLGHLQRLEEADKAFARAVQIHAKLVADFPEVGHYWTALFRDYRDQGNMLWACGRSREADQAFGQAHELGDRMATAFPPDRLVDDCFAAFLLNCPNLKWREASRAREFASKAIARNSPSADAWRTLGIAEYRLGAHAKAIAAFEKALTLQKDNPLSEQFFTAMAHWRLGQEQQARQWFEKAATSMNETGRQDDDLVRFRAEAAALLGIRDSPQAIISK
jgi:serine/threonine protein kinase